jgi:glycine betaine/proline transport system ATP-binding protein
MYGRYSAPVNEQVVISCRNVWKIFGPRQELVPDVIEKGMAKEEALEKTGLIVAVKDVSFDVKKGEVFVIMGLSGSGKSTIIRCLNRIIEPTTGRTQDDTPAQDVHGFSAFRPSAASFGYR